MSRIGKKPITIPEGVTVVFENGVLKANGPKGENSVKIPDGVTVDVDGQTVTVKARSEVNRPIQGTIRTLIANAIDGVCKDFEKKLEIKGVGFRAKVEGSALVLQVGFSHPVSYQQPEGIAFSVKGNYITVSGYNKQQVGEVSAQIRNIRPPDAYKGKGLRYVGEVVKLKPGKAVKTAGGTGAGA